MSAKHTLVDELWRAYRALDDAYDNLCQSVGVRRSHRCSADWKAVEVARTVFLIARREEVADETAREGA